MEFSLKLADARNEEYERELIGWKERVIRGSFGRRYLCMATLAHSTKILTPCSQE
jgi:hypothetical protein